MSNRFLFKAHNSELNQHSRHSNQSISIQSALYIERNQYPDNVPHWQSN